MRHRVQPARNLPAIPLPWISSALPAFGRYALGHFPESKKHPYRDIPLSVVGSEEHVQLARTAATASMVLLKNDPPVPAGGADGGAAEGSIGQAGSDAAKPLLPLRLDQLRRLTVLGPLANRSGACCCCSGANTNALQGTTSSLLCCRQHVR
jgi:beta-glucosidase-like glycosyl hydrolase